MTAAGDGAQVQGGEVMAHRPSGFRPSWASAATTFACVAIALIGAYLLAGPLDGVFFAFPLAVISLLSMTRGQAAGLTASALIPLGLALFLIEPRFGLAVPQDYWVRLVVFVSSAVVISLAAGAQHRSRERLVLERSSALLARAELEGARESLRHANSLLEGITRGTDDMIAATDSELRFLYFNEAYRREFQRLWGRDIEVGTGLVEALAPWPEEQRKATDLWRRALGGESFRVTTSFGPSEGEKKTYELRFNPVLAADGRQIGAAHIFRDVTDRAALEEALRESETRYRELADAMPQLVWTATPDGVVDYYNVRHRELAGITRDPGGEWSWAPVLHPEDVQRTLDAWQNAVRTGTAYDIEHRVRIADGSYRWFLSRGVPARDETGAVRKWYGTATDIDRQKRTEQALRDSQQLLQSTMDHFPTVIAFKDREGRFLAVNHVVERVLGLPKEKIVGRRIHDFIPREAADVLHQHELEVMESRRAVQLEEVTPLPDGTRIHLNTNFPLIDADGRVYGTGHISHEITELKRAQEALHLANEKLREADRRKDEFLGMLSHELRNPLTPIRNSLYILDRAAPTGEQVRRSKEVIQRQVGHLTRLVDDLLDVTRIARGKVELRRAPLDLTGLARRTAEDYRALMGQRGLEFAVELTGQSLWVEGDETRLAQVLGNLLQNAAKFTRPGGRVALVLDAVDGAAELRVRDTGAGIRPELLEHVFEPFTQAEQTLARTEGGLGLGLALVKGLVELHGGTVTAASGGEGQGTEFTVRLPARAAVAPVLQGGSVADQPTEARRRVLVVDDNCDAAESLAEFVRLLGHEAEIAFDGPSAVELARRFRPEIVLCDLGLPGMSGYEVARTLRAELGDRVRLVAVTGYAQAKDRKASADAGFDRHVAKPPDADEIERLLG